MHKVEPEVFVIGETRVNREELDRWLEAIGASDWSTDASSDLEEIIEVDSRGCYMSFGTGLNPNISRVREGNRAHLGNILNVGHGSVLEHGFVNFQFHNVSRVFTHELVRHRAGVAISQESLRFVRLTDLGMWIPSCFAGDSLAESAFTAQWNNSEHAYQTLIYAAVVKEFYTRTDYIDLKAADAFVESLGGIGHPRVDEEFNKLSFAKKKEYTSAARRVAPIGLATNIGWSCNIRALRHVIEMRTDPGAEEEIRFVFNLVSKIAQQRWPSVFQDYDSGEIHRKV